ncbi:outer spore coat protein CotE [Geosporobacter ferrireducens]|uniref:Spore coat protein n=2 Tax=Geosporobacter ferrireducens TaxID=1424294 RepID=A0A1D8GKT7_9FIRM|nr:outer spore coat protein CotE [Geosporobacter ferrireducens]AOT71520.1 hypothetical protein Gferi_19485 [Geosporobacter ferrireducens]
MDKKNEGRMRTIITTAVCGNASHIYQTTIHITGNENADPSRVLGCTITNAKIVDSKFENSNIKNINVRVNGQFEIHVWYEANGDTKISKNIAKFSELIQVENIEGISLSTETDHKSSIITKINKDPVSLGTSVVNISGVPTIAIQVEYELGVEVVGEVRLEVLTYPNNPQQEEDETHISETIFSGEEYGEDDD